MIHDTFKYIGRVTYSNMTELLSKLKEKEKIENICKEHSLNLALLKNLFLLAAKGYNNTELAPKLGVHRVTVQRYNQTLRNMDPNEYSQLFKYVMIWRENDETSNLNETR